MPKPAVIVFDVNETLSDMAPMAQRFAAVGLPEHVAATWFASVLREGFALAAAGTEAPFAQIASSVLRGLLLQAGVRDDLDGKIDQVLGGFMQLDVHPDVPDGVRALKADGLRLVTLTNGGAAVPEALLRRAGLREEFERVMSVEAAGVWKPAPASYGYAARECGVPLADMLMVAVHPWDVDGAARAGMQSAWIDRSGAAYPPYATPPTYTASGLTDLAAQLQQV